MFGYFYHEIFRRTIIAFGTLFNNISIRHVDNNGDIIDMLKVPLAYGPTQKFLARLNQSPDLNKPVAITLPRLSFEMTGITYDPTRKLTTTQVFTVADPTNKQETKKAYMPVPYNMQFDLSVMCLLNDDALQIIEQILPFFQPAYTLSIDLLDTIKEKRDIPIVLESITMQDDYEGDFTTRRVLIYTLRFSAKTYLFGPVSSATNDIIKKVSVSYVASSTTTTPVRELVYSSQPRAFKNYTGVISTNLSSDISPTDTILYVNDSTSILPNTYLDLNGEEIFVKSIEGNILTVERGKDNTIATIHLSGSPIKPITQADNNLIPSGDDFGFTGLTQ